MNQALCHTLGKLFIRLKLNIYKAMEKPVHVRFCLERTHRSGLLGEFVYLSLTFAYRDEPFFQENWKIYWTPIIVLL